MNGFAFELHEVIAFQCLARHLNYRLASRKLGITQPALTKKIQNLEAKLGGVLIFRDYHGAQLSPAGKFFFEKTKTIMEQLQEVTLETEAILKGKAGLLRIGFGNSSISSFLNHAIADFRKDNASIELSMKNMSSASQVQALINQEIDIGFVRLPIKAKELFTVEVMTDNIVLAVPETSDYVSIKKLSDAASFPFILLSPDMSQSFHDLSLKLCSSAKFYPRVVQLSHEFFSMLNLTGVGLGISILPGSMRNISVPNVRWVNIERSEFKIGLAWRKNENSKLVNGFIRAIIEKKSK